MGVFEPVIELGRGLAETLRSRRPSPFNIPKKSGQSIRVSVAGMC